MNFTVTERLILINQYQILGLLEAKDSEKYANWITILQEGYTRHYSEFGGTIDDNPDDHIDTMTKEVCNILEMHRVMLDRYRQLSDKGGISTEDIAFRGFDKGEEAAQYLYITFLLDKLGRYKESKSDDYDSGKPLLNKYQGMLEQWNISKDKHNLTAEDLRRITGILA